MPERLENGSVDITQLMRDCAENYLSTKDPYLADAAIFNLHDAMSATQLFDPKLDCCEIPGEKVAPWNTVGEPVFPRPVPTALDDPMSPLPWKMLSMSEAATISIQMLVRLHSLLLGSGVGDSCFTCLYAHFGVLDDMASRLLLMGDIHQDQESLIDSLEKLSFNGDSDNHNTELAQWALFATALGLVVLSEKIRSIIQNADIYEEEDFTVAAHGLRFFELSNPIAYAKVWKFVERKLSANLAEDEQSRIPLLVVRCFSSFYSACLTLEKISTETRSQALDYVKVATEQTTQALSELSGLLSVTPDENDEESSKLIQKCFDPFMVRPLVGNLPVRAFSFESPKKAVMELTAIVSELTNQVCRLFEKGVTLGRIQRLLSCLRGKNILTRSFVLANLYCADKLLGIHPFERLISDHLQHLFSAQTEPEPWLSTPDAVCFLKRLAKPIYDVLKLSLLNQNRLRAHLEVFLIPEWAAIQKEAQAIDYQYQLQNGSSFPHFTHFVLTNVVKLMDLYVSSGIQDGLVSCNHTDLWFHFWYRDFLLSTVNQHVSIIQKTKDTSVLRVEEKKEPITSSKRSKKKSKHKNGKRPVAETTTVPNPEDLEDNFQLKIVALRRNICRKTIHFLAALSQAAILPEATYEFTTLEHIFERRFEIFCCVQQPPRLSYQQFLEGTDFTKVSLAEFPLYISDGFHHCRAAIDQLMVEWGRLDPSWSGMEESELKALRKVCIGNSVYAQKLAQIVASGEASVASFDFSVHGEFCIIRLSASTTTTTGVKDK